MLCHGNCIHMVAQRRVVGQRRVYIHGYTSCAHDITDSLATAVNQHVPFTQASACARTSLRVQIRTGASCDFTTKRPRVPQSSSRGAPTSPTR